VETAPQPAPIETAAVATAGGSRWSPRWILAGAAGIALVIVGLNFRGNPVKPAPPAPVTAPPPAVVPVVVAPDPKESPFGERPKPSFTALDKPVAKPVDKPVDKPVVKPETNPANMWRVIAYTYLSRELAAGKAGEVNQEHPGFEATVFEPQDKKGRYLVALGGFMTRGEALRVQGKARAAGLSRNVYIHDFAE
jgi:hypothetical protein